MDPQAPLPRQNPPRIKMPARPDDGIDDGERRLKDIVATVGDWIWETNAALELTFVSERFCETTGLAADALLGRTLPDVALAHDRPTKGVSAPAVSFTLAHRKPFKNIACSLQTGSGEVLHFTFCGVPYFSDGDVFGGYRGAAQNITPQLDLQRQYHQAKQTPPSAPSPQTPGQEAQWLGRLRKLEKSEKSLRDRVTRYALAVRGAGEHVWDWDLRGDRVFMAAELRDLTGYRSTRITSKSWLQRIHGDDRAAYLGALNAHLEGQSPSFHSVCRLCHKNGEVRWVRIAATAVRDRSGQAKRMVGLVGEVSAPAPAH